MPGAAHPLQESSDGTGCAELANQVHVANINAQLQRCRRHQCLQLAFLQTGFGRQPLLTGQAAVVGGDMLLAYALAQRPRQPLRHTPSVDENQRSAVLRNQLRHTVINRLGRLVGQHRLQGRIGQFNAQVEPPDMARINDVAIDNIPTAPLWRRGVGGISHQKPRHLCNRLLGGGKSNSMQAPAGQTLQAFQRQRQMGTSFAADNGVDFVYDDGAHRLQHPPAALASKQEVARLRRGHQNMRRLLQHGRPRHGRRIPGAQHGADRHLGVTQFE